MSEQSPEKKRKYLPIVIAGVIVAALCGISLYLRIALPYHDIFVNNQTVWFRETDAYYYMRHIETVFHNFPHFNSFDPYQIFPGGMVGLTRPFYAWLVAAVIFVVKGAAASLHDMEVVAAYVPAILGTLTLIPVYFIGKELFNRWVGVISAAIVMIMPSEFLHRSLLGFNDHHVAETLFSTVCILFLIMAIKRAREKEISFAHLLARDWSTVRKPLIYTVLAGIFLGVYLLAWIGGLLFMFIIFAYLVIQFIVDHLRHRSTDYLCIIGTPVFLIAFLMLLPILSSGGLDTIYRVSMSIAIVLPIVLSILSRVMSGRTLKPVYYPLALVGLGVIGLVALYVSNPSLFQYMRSLFGVFAPSGATLTIMEVAPLLFPNGQFSLAMAWSNFNFSFFIAFVSMGMLVYVTVKEKSADKILLLVWSVLILMAVLGQRRFGYYYTINLALLTGYFTWKMLDLAGLNKLMSRSLSKSVSKSREVVKAVKKFKKKEKRSREQAKTGGFMQPRGVWARVIVVGIILFVVVFLPSIRPAIALAGSGNFVMDEGWYNSLLWLKDSSNSPEPFDNPDFYYELYPPQNEFEYPASAYGVMSWWDYGHFIMQIAHRIPNANPTQTGAVKAGEFFTALNESSANEVADEEGTKYVVIDYMMATSKFYAMAQWANKTEDDFYGLYYYVPQGSEQYQVAILYYRAYYESMVARLYNFDGKKATPTQPLVISYEEKTGSTGQKYKELTSVEPFDTYEEAQTYVANQTAGNYRIVGVDAFSSIVPLEEISSYERVYPAGANLTINQTTVKIFRYLGWTES
jgi:dolichyl-phosphooligosaccharide-protein glycotransferase